MFMRNILVIFFLINYCLSAQNYSVKGVLYDTNNQPVEGAEIILNYDKIFKSDLDGKFLIENIKKSKVDLTIYLQGFAEQNFSLDFELKNEIDLGNIYFFQNKKLDEVVVSGTLKPVSKLNSQIPVEVYGKSFFKSNITPSVFESLQNINGVRPQLNCSVCNTGDIHINGQDGAYTMILIDGLPMVSGLSSVYGLSGIPQSLIEKIEVIKGPASAIYGSEAIGGLINIITKLPEYSDKLSLETYYTGWGEKNFDLGYKYKFLKKINSMIGINYFNYSNPIDKNEDGFTDLSIQDRISIFNKINLKDKFSIASRFYYEDRWGGELDWGPTFRGSDLKYGESIYTTRFELYGNLDLNKNLKFQLSYNNHNQNSYYGLTFYDAKQADTFVQFLYNKSISLIDFTFGLSYRNTFYDDNSTATYDEILNKNAPSKTAIPGVFVQNELKFSEKNSILLGLRYDYNSLHKSIFTPRINYKRVSDDESSVIRVGVGSGFRVVNIFTEEHAALSGDRIVVFEEELRPEKSWNFNINYVKNIYTDSDIILEFDSSLFYTNFSNKIIPNYNIDPNKIIYKNLTNSSITRGGSLSLNSTFSSGLRINLGVTFLDNYIDNIVKERPELTESFLGVWRVSYNIKSFTIDYTGNILGPMILPKLSDIDPRSSKSPLHSIQNIQITNSISNGLQFYVGVKNLLDFVPAKNSIARPFDPFDKLVEFDSSGNVLQTSDNPYALTFDASHVYNSNQGIRVFAGLRFILN